MLITFLIKLSKYPQNTNTVVAKFNIMLRRLTTNEFFWFLAILGSSFSGKSNHMPCCWNQDRLWPGHVLTLLWVWSIAVRYWKAEQLLAQTAHLRAANITFPLCDL